jgi:hypothetical protein
MRTQYRANRRRLATALTRALAILLPAIATLIAHYIARFGDKLGH